MRWIIRTISWFFIAPLIAFWGTGANATEVKVAAAASLTDVINALTQAYEEVTPGVRITASFAGSSTLAKHIVHGAYADIFISADQEWMDYLDKQNLLQSDSRRALASNELVLITPAATQFQMSLEQEQALPRTLQTLSGRLCTGDVTHVPVGKYAKQALEHYGWYDDLQDRLVATEDARTALAFVARGECALGIVYRTDARLSKKVRVLATFPPESHAPIVYPGALTKKAGEAGKAFWQFLQSREAAAIFAAQGFTAVQPTVAPDK